MLRRTRVNPISRIPAKKMTSNLIKYANFVLEIAAKHEQRERNQTNRVDDVCFFHHCQALMNNGNAFCTLRERQLWCNPWENRWPVLPSMLCTQKINFPRDDLVEAVSCHVNIGHTWTRHMPLCHWGRHNESSQQMGNRIIYCEKENIHFFHLLGLVCILWPTVIWNGKFSARENSPQTIVHSISGRGGIRVAIVMCIQTTAVAIAFSA